MGSCELEYESFGGLATPEWSSWELSHAPGMLLVHRKNGALGWMGLTSFSPFFLWFHEAWHTFLFFLHSYQEYISLYSSVAKR